MTAAEHVAAVQAWWADRDARVRRPDGWLTLVGLCWLTPGENHVGAHPSSHVLLQAHEIPPRVGSMWLEDGGVRFVPNEGVDLPETVLEDDRGGAPTMLELGTLRFNVIRRGERIGVRVRDTSAPALARFAGLDHYAIDPSWRVQARLEPAEADAVIEIVDITGQASQEPMPGRVAFERDGATWRIAALPGDDDGSLWLIFGDATNGAETYGGGRFLYTEPLVADGSVVVDFNLAYNPPCVFSPFATCPLPPAENRLALRIEAGERTYSGAG